MAIAFKVKNGCLRYTANLVGVVFYGLSAMIGLMLSRDGRRSLETIKKVVRLRFPCVQQLHIKQLKSWLEDEHQDNLLLLDVRTLEEYAYSHIPGAIHINPNTSAADAIAMIGHSHQVVVYCSVGYRSSQLASRLLERGVGDVVNLEGSIFAWANEGYLLEKEGSSVTKVHPYSRFAGKLLHQKVRGML